MTMPTTEGGGAVSGTRYEIVLRGRLSPRLAHALEGFEVVAAASNSTRLVGIVRDQSSLQAVVRRVSDLGLDLVSIRSVDDA